MNWKKDFRIFWFNSSRADYARRQFEDFIELVIKDTQRKTLDLIANEECWELNRDHYAKLLGLKTKYEK